MNFTHCEVVGQAINPSAVLSQITDFGHGAQNFFFGAVRASNGGREVIAVEYDAFVPLAEQVLREIASEVRKQWGPDLKICILHRLGRLTVGTISVAIGVSSTHRDEAYQASRAIIEQIKIRVPIWKKEYYVNGETEWLEGHALCQRTHGELAGGAHEHCVQNNV